MGLVKIDVHKADRIHHGFSWGDVSKVKNLIKNKRNDHTDRMRDGNVSEEVICNYADLDMYIKKVKFNEKQSFILKAIMYGYTEEDLAEHYGQRKEQIEKILHTIAEKIVKITKAEWKYNYIYLNYKKVAWSYKECTSCHEFHPMLDEFYGKDTRNKDGFKGICKSCDRK